MVECSNSPATKVQKSKDDCGTEAFENDVADILREENQKAMAPFKRRWKIMRMWSVQQVARECF